MPKHEYIFDNASVLGQFSEASSKAISYGKVKITDGKASGNSLKMSIDRNEFKGKAPYRGDLRLAGDLDNIPLNTPVTYKFTFTMSNRFVCDPYFSDILAQWLPRTRNKGGPVLGLHLRNNRLNLVHNDPEFGIETKFLDGAKRYIENLIGTDKEKKWVDVEVNSTWSLTSSGKLQVLYNGEEIYSGKGRNCDSTDRAPAFKFGPYKSGWRDELPANQTELTRRVMYFQKLSVEW